MSNNNVTIEKSSGGIGFMGLLTVVFVTLKLTDNIDWSWWLVLGPLWMPITFAIVVGALWVAFDMLVRKKK